MESRTNKKPNSDFVIYLNAYLDEAEFEKITQNKKHAEDEHKQELEKYHKASQAYLIEKSNYKITQEVFKKNQEKYAQEIEAYKKIPTDSLPIPPIAPTMPVSPSYPVMHDDPRVVSRTTVKRTLESDSVGLLSRVFNAFHFEFMAKDNLYSAIDNTVTERQCNAFFDIMEKGKFEVVSKENNNGILEVDSKSEISLKQLAADLTFNSCQALLDERGQLHTDIVRSLNLQDIETKWQKTEKQHLLSQILPQVLFSYCSQFLIGALTELGMQHREMKSHQRETAGLLLLYIQNQLYAEKEGKPTEFFLSQIECYRAYSSITYSSNMFSLSQLTALATLSQTSGWITPFTEDDADGHVFNSLVYDINAWRNKANPHTLGWYARGSEEHKLYFAYQPNADMQTISTHAVKKMLMSSLLQVIMMAAQQRTSTSLRKVIDDWKDAKIGPYYLDNKTDGMPYDTHYAVLTIQRGWKTTVSETQSIVDHALQLLTKPVNPLTLSTSLH